MTKPTFAEMRPRYELSWRNMAVELSRKAIIDAEARDIHKDMDAYLAVESITGVPACIIAVIHNRESDRDFKTHLHNGDPLSARTYHVPAGRPETGSPPFSWIQSAVDALRYQGMDKVRDWTVERACYVLEDYNGWGYWLFHSVDSPYLWAATNIQDAGKYVEDGKWNRTAYDSQLGCMPVLAALWALDKKLRLPTLQELELDRTEWKPGPVPKVDIPPPKPTPRPQIPGKVIPIPAPPASNGPLVAAIVAILAGMATLFQPVRDWIAHLLGG